MPATGGGHRLETGGGFYSITLSLHSSITPLLFRLSLSSAPCSADYLKLALADRS